MKTVFLRVLEADDKAAALHAAIVAPKAAQGRQRFELDTASFAAVPRSPFAYWVSERLRCLFKELPSFEADGRTAKQGLATADDFRFVRCWWAVSPQLVNERWFPFCKGGSFSPFYADVHLVVKWERRGEEIKNNLNDSGGVRSNIWMLRDTAANYFFRPGLSYPARPHGSGWFSAVPTGCVFSHNGPMVFTDDDELLTWLGLLSARPFHHLVQLMMARGQGGSGQTLTYEVGMIACTPVPHLDAVDASALHNLARRAWSLKRSVDTHTETSHAFTLPALLQVSGDTLAARADTWAERAHTIEAELSSIQGEIDVRCFNLYGMDEADRRSITEGFGAQVDGLKEPADTNADGDAGPDFDSDEDDAASGADTVSLAAELISWVVGVVFGRFDLRLASGARGSLDEPEPFERLPVCSPAMLTGDKGLPLTSAPAGYPLAFSETGILVDDPGQASDLIAAVRLVFDEVFNARADACWNEATGLLDPQSQDDLRSWLASSFFEHHLKRYSKSRRKAPIIWQLAVPTGRYSVWLYAHRMNRDSFFQIQNDVVTPKLAHEERQLASMTQSEGLNPSARGRKEIAAQEAFVEELRAMLDEVKRVTPLWNPTLDDGVALTMAPLWRLVPQHKPWQKELKSKWDELAVGKYDWAHLAMHLWPERVVPKCATDRSLAIAHGLESVFWVEGDDGKWKPRPAPTRAVDELVRERTSIAVKAALKSLLEAPAANANGGRARGRRVANAVTDGGAR